MIIAYSYNFRGNLVPFWIRKCWKQPLKRLAWLHLDSWEAFFKRRRTIPKLCYQIKAEIRVSYELSLCYDCDSNGLPAITEIVALDRYDAQFCVDTHKGLGQNNLFCSMTILQAVCNLCLTGFRFELIVWQLHVDRWITHIVLQIRDRVGLTDDEDIQLCA